jgi:hypothetical protein
MSSIARPWAMALTTVSALYLAVAARNVLLLAVAVFSFWSSRAGGRWFDGIAAALTLLFSAAASSAPGG